MKLYLTVSFALAFVFPGHFQDPEAAEVLRHLSDPDPKVRRQAIDRAERLDLEAAVPRLVELLADSAESTGVAASRALEYLDFRVDAALLLGRVQSGHVDFELAKPLLIRWAGPEQHSALLSAVRDEKCPWREGALRILGRLGARNAVPLMLEWIVDPKHPLRRDAVEYLVDVKETAAIPKLRQWAISSEPHECQTAIRGLVNLEAKDLGPDVLKIVKEGTDIHKQIPGCAFSGGFEIFDYRRLLLATRRELMVPTLESWLSDTDPKRRCEAAGFLGDLEHRESAGKIGKLLADEDDGVRSAAISALGSLKSKDHLVALLAIAADTKEELRGTAAEALGRIGGEKAVATLRSLTGDSSRFVRVAALQGLAEATPDSCGSELIRGALDETDPWVICRILESIALTRVRGSGPALVRLLGSKNMHVRECVVDAIKSIRPREQADEIAERALSLESGYERRDAASVACSLGSRSAGEYLLAEAIQGEGASLATLNALREPRLWEKLATLPVGRSEGSMADMLGNAAVQLGISFSMPAASDRQMRRWLNQSMKWSRPTFEEVASLAPGILVDSNGLRVVTRAETITFWKAWFAENSRR